ncbi:MAG: hypothetical protein IPK32_21235 [Verrucomicrobiaceae bacterium]|nr:hypothetical protein [Verrucomicrobiaceae bacterium]
MKGFIKECECTILGLMMTILPLGLIGATKVFICGGTSDGILFDLLFYGLPLWIVAPFVIASQCGLKPRVRKVCRIIVCSYLVLALASILVRSVTN